MFRKGQMKWKFTALAALAVLLVADGARAEEFTPKADHEQTKGRIGTIESNVAELQARATELEALVTTLQAALTAAETRIGSLETAQVMWADIQGIPAGFADGVDDDTDTQLSEAEVDVCVANNGYLTSEADPTVLAAVKDGVDWSEVTSIPSDIADGDHDTHLSKLEIETLGFVDGPHTVDTTLSDADVAAFGYIKSYTETDPTVAASVKDGVDWFELASIPDGFADGVDDDTDTQLGEAEVDAYVANNGYLTSETDPTVLAAVKDGVDWFELTSIPSDIADGDDDTVLTEATVDDYVANNGYLTSETDPTVLAAVKDGVDWGELVSIPAGFADGVDDVGTSGLDPYVTVAAGTINGLAGPHVIFEGVNVHVRSGSGFTDDGGTLAGLGNLVLGYNEEKEYGMPPYARGGSHNLVIGTEHQFSSFGGFVAGHHNTISGGYSSISGGLYGTAYGACSSVSGGIHNTASGIYSSVSGGYANEASADGSSVSGGNYNKASGDGSSVSGGNYNKASGDGSSASGGQNNSASGDGSSASGGQNNTASGWLSSVSGGGHNTASGGGSSVSGGGYGICGGFFSGDGNTASGIYSSVSGGYENLASGEYSSVSSGHLNTAGALFTSVSGGVENTASGSCSSVSGGRVNEASHFYSTVSGGDFRATRYADDCDYDRIFDLDARVHRLEVKHDL